MQRLLALALVAALTPGCFVTRSGKLDYAPAAGLAELSPAADEAVVVFLRPAFMGHGISAVVYEDDAFVSIVMARSHVIHRTTPGTHRYMVISESADFMDAELEGGEVYFAEVQPRTGAWRARFSLAPVHANGDDAEDLAQWLEASYAVRPNALSTSWSEANAESVRAKQEDKLEQWLAKPERPRLGPDDGLPGWPPEAR